MLNPVLLVKRRSRDPDLLLSKSAQHTAGFDGLDERRRSIRSRTILEFRAPGNTERHVERGGGDAVAGAWAEKFDLAIQSSCLFFEDRNESSISANLHNSSADKLRILRTLGSERWSPAMDSCSMIAKVILASGYLHSLLV